jgi:sterol desaturase/sphingolipid hydroxylase (fatty acid hydroxylase superfamily)
MVAILEYFEQIPSWQRACILAGGIAFFWIIENAQPLFRFSYNKWKHAGTNLFFTLTTIAVNFSFAYLLVNTSFYFSNQGWGILQQMDAPLMVEVIVALFLLDFIGAYLIHLIQHKVKWMWRFHLVHHSDVQVDTTTANRHHPVESVFRAVFTILAVGITGANIGMVMLYQSLSVILSQFNHANITLPGKVDKAIGLLLVSPNMHKVHHHFEQPFTDSNYGNIFSIWDRIFDTFMVKRPHEIIYGVDVLGNSQDNTITEQLMLPFKEQ